jgi:hypothetical protein
MKVYEPVRDSVLESDTTFFEVLFAGSSSAPAALQENGDGVPLPVCDEVDTISCHGNRTLKQKLLCCGLPS